MFLIQIGQVTGRLLFLLFSLWFLNRHLGVEAKGAWVGVYSLFSILAVCSNMGFELWLSREAAADRLSSTQARQFLFRFKTPLWLLCLTIGSYKILLDSGELALALPFAAALIFDGVGVAQQAIFEGKKAAVQLTIMSFLKSGGFALIALGVGLSVADTSLPLYGWLFALVLLVRTIWGLRAFKLLPSDPRPVKPGIWSDIVHMGAWTMVTVLYFKIDAVMLSDMAGDLVTGQYGNAYDFVEGSLFISAAAGSVLYPRLVTASEAERGRIFDTIFKLIMVLAAVGVTALWTVGVQLGLLFAGEGFQGSIPLLSILAIGLPFMFGNGLLSRWLFSTGQESFALKTSASLAVFNIVGNALLIPRFGASGAACMTIATEGLLFLIWIIFGRRNVKLLLFCILPASLAAGVGLLVFYAQQFWGAILTSVILLGPLLWIHLKKVHLMRD